MNTGPWQIVEEILKICSIQNTETLTIDVAHGTRQTFSSERAVKVEAKAQKRSWCFVITSGAPGVLGRPQSKLGYSQGKKYDEHIHVQINSVINLIPDIWHFNITRYRLCYSSSTCSYLETEYANNNNSSSRPTTFRRKQCGLNDKQCPWWKLTGTWFEKFVVYSLDLYGEMTLSFHTIKKFGSCLWLFFRLIVQSNIKEYNATIIHHTGIKFVE